MDKKRDAVGSLRGLSRPKKLIRFLNYHFNSYVKDIFTEANISWNEIHNSRSVMVLI